MIRREGEKQNLTSKKTVKLKNTYKCMQTVESGHSTLVVFDLSQISSEQKNLMYQEFKMAHNYQVVPLLFSRFIGRHNCLYILDLVALVKLARKT